MTHHHTIVRLAAIVMMGMLATACHKKDKTERYTLITRDATAVTDRSATMQGNISVEHASGTYTVGFFLAETGTPTAESHSLRVDVGTGVKGDFEASAIFEPGKRYNYCAFAQYKDSLYSYGSTMNFTTKALQPQPKAQQSVLVYIAGDNNLASFIMDDVRQMMTGSRQLTTGEDNLLLYIDQTGRPPYMLYMFEGDTIRQQNTGLERKTSDAETLKDAMQWMMTNYPADKYGLVLWGHADGWIIEGDGSRATSKPRHAYGVDQTGGEQWMNIPDMARALESVCAGQPLRFIFADCCCFQCVESAYELRHATDYIIASAAEIPGEGAPYQTVIPALFSRQDDFYRQAADAYYQQTSYGYQEPMAVVKTSAMEALAEATGTTLTASLLPTDDGTTVYPNVDGLIYYYDLTLFDMQDFMLRHAATDVYTQWHQALSDAIVYSTMTPVWMANHVPYLNANQRTLFRDFDVTAERYCGLSMFVAQDPSRVASSYRSGVRQQNNHIKDMQWYDAAGLSRLGW